MRTCSWTKNFSLQFDRTIQYRYTHIGRKTIFYPHSSCLSVYNFHNVGCGLRDGAFNSLRWSIFYHLNMFVYRISLLCVATVHVDEKTLAEKKLFVPLYSHCLFLTIFILNLIKEKRHSVFFEIIEILSFEHFLVEKTSSNNGSKLMHTRQHWKEKRFLSILLVSRYDFDIGCHAIVNV